MFDSWIVFGSVIKSSIWSNFRRNFQTFRRIVHTHKLSICFSTNYIFLFCSLDVHLHGRVNWENALFKFNALNWFIALNHKQKNKKNEKRDSNCGIEHIYDLSVLNGLMTPDANFVENGTQMTHSEKFFIFFHLLLLRNPNIAKIYLCRIDRIVNWHCVERECATLSWF